MITIGDVFHSAVMHINDLPIPIPMPIPVPIPIPMPIPMAILLPIHQPG